MLLHNNGYMSGWIERYYQCFRITLHDAAWTALMKTCGYTLHLTTDAHVIEGIAAASPRTPKQLER